MKQLFLLVLLATLPLAGHAQTAASSLSRWHLEAQAAYQRFNGLSGGGDTDARQTAEFFGPLLQVDYRLSRHFSVVTGIGAASRGWHSIPFIGFGIPELRYFVQAKSASIYVPLLVRWHLNERPTSRCQVALQAGVTLLQQTAARRIGTTWMGSEEAPVYGSAEPSQTRRDLPLTLGLRVAYRVAPRWEVAAAGQATMSYHSQTQGGNSTALNADRPAGGGSLGIGYSFLTK